MASVRNPVALAVLSLAVVAASCGDSPVAPDPSRPSASSPSPQPVPPTSATLAIEDLSVIAKRTSMGASAPDGSFFLEVRFLLRETGGNSGATVVGFFVGDGRGGGDAYGGYCLEGGLRVLPGGVYDRFYTNEGYESWSYCAPHYGVVAAPIKESPVFLTVNFVDDDGHVGLVSAKAVWKY